MHVYIYIYNNNSSFSGILAAINKPASSLTRLYGVNEAAECSAKTARIYIYPKIWQHGGRNQRE